jgi:hypothetical protein
MAQDLEFLLVAEPVLTVTRGKNKGKPPPIQKETIIHQKVNSD